MRQLGSTGLQVSALGLGTVKLGRDKGTRYPDDFTIPDQRSAARLLALARDLGINLLDTAPAYGHSEQRLGELLHGQRNNWLLCTKVGEEFEGGQSRFDFSPEYTRQSVQRSLRRLRTDVLDIVLVHSDGQDLRIIEQLGTLQALQQMKAEGLIRAVGISSKTLAGGLAAVADCDLLMLTYNLQEQEQEPVLAACARSGKGGLLKKALGSGHLVRDGRAQVEASMALALGHPGTSAAVVGTISPDHLEENIVIARGFMD